MITKEAALHSFFSQFGIPAYEDTSVPDDVVFPYITYQSTTGVYGDGIPVSITARLYYYTDSNAIPNAKVQEISDAIGARGVRLDHDGGFIYMTHGNPWCIKTNDESVRTVKVRILNITLKYYSL